MADRIACSCVTCPKCATWVVVKQPSETGLDKEKFRASCPVPECGKGFEFDADEARVFEIPYRSLSGAISSVQNYAEPPGATLVQED